MWFIVLSIIQLIMQLFNSLHFIVQTCNDNKVFNLIQLTDHENWFHNHKAINRANISIIELQIEMPLPC